MTIHAGANMTYYAQSGLLLVVRDQERRHCTLVRPQSVVSERSFDTRWGPILPARLTLLKVSVPSVGEEGEEVRTFVLLQLTVAWDALRSPAVLTRTAQHMRVPSHLMPRLQRWWRRLCAERRVRLAAVCMGGHARLGAASPLRALDEGVLRRVAELVVFGRGKM